MSVLRVLWGSGGSVVWRSQCVMRIGTGRAIPQIGRSVRPMAFQPFRFGGGGLLVVVGCFGGVGGGRVRWEDPPRRRLWSTSPVSARTATRGW